jgi:ubiquinone/menaquinone biosynthesis C-methylase UbiE
MSGGLQLAMVVIRRAEVKPKIDTGYNYDVSRWLTTAKNVRDAIEITVFNYFHDQLGLTEQFCRERTALEEQRAIPKNVLNQLRVMGWDFEGKKVLDLGAGQGGMVLELLEQSVFAYGIEPGREFASLARMRLRAAGHDPDHVRIESGESLTFPDNYFDYVISLQVLEHVPSPEAVLREIFRVLRPGGQCSLSCDNYLTFREPHYRVAWLPLLPKTIGSFYLTFRGRNPEFLKKHIYYRTYLEIIRICSAVGFANLTHDHWFKKLEEPHRIRTPYLRHIAGFLGCFPSRMSTAVLRGFAHSKNAFKPVVSVVLQKPVQATNAEQKKG